MFDLEFGDIFLADCFAEVVGAVGSPVKFAVPEGDVVGVLNTEAYGVVRFDGSYRRGGPVVVEAALVSGPAIEREVDVVEDDVVRATVGTSPDADAVFCAAGDILQVDVVEGSDVSIRACVEWL